MAQITSDEYCGPARFPFYNRSGNRHILEGLPDSISMWSLDESLQPAQRKLIDDLEKTLGDTVTAVTLCGSGMNETYRVDLARAEAVFVRRPTERDLTARPLWTRIRSDSEANLLRWLRQRSNVPVPRVVFHSSDFLVMEKLPGKNILQWYGVLGTTQKENFIISLARTAVEICSIAVPQQIGSTSPAPLPDGIIITPRVGVPPFETAPQVYDTIHEFFDYLFTVRRSAALRACTIEGEKQSIEELLTALDAYVRPLLDNLPCNMLHCVLAHNDLNDNNILFSETTGELTGVIDLEYHSVVPVCLAAEYPRFLRRDGRYDPRYCDEYTWWLESPEESERLLALFEQVAQKQSAEYYEALVSGKQIRIVAEWLLNVGHDPKSKALRMWAETEGIFRF